MNFMNKLIINHFIRSRISRSRSNNCIIKLINLNLLQYLCIDIHIASLINKIVSDVDTISNTCSGRKGRRA